MGNKVSAPTPSPPPETWTDSVAHFAIRITSTTGGLLHSASDTLSSVLGYPRTSTIASSQGKTTRSQGSTKSTRLQSSSERRSHQPTRWSERDKKEIKKPKSKSKKGPRAVPNAAANVPDFATNVRVIVGDAWLQAGEIVEAAGVYAAELTSATSVNFRLSNLKIADVLGRDMNKHAWSGLALSVLLLLTLVCKVFSRLFRSPRHKPTPVDSTISTAERERTVVATIAQDTPANPPALAPAEPETYPETRKDEVPPTSMERCTGDHFSEVVVSDQTGKEVSRPDNAGRGSPAEQCSEPSTSLCGGESAADTKVPEVTGIYEGETLEDSSVGNDKAEASCVNDASVPAGFSQGDGAESVLSVTENLQMQMAGAQGGSRLEFRSRPGAAEGTSILEGVSGEEPEPAKDTLESGNGESTAGIMLSQVGDEIITEESIASSAAGADYVPKVEACVTQDSAEAKGHMAPEQQVDDAMEDSSLPQGESVAVKSEDLATTTPQAPTNLTLVSTSIMKGGMGWGKEKVPDLSAAVAAAGACDSASSTALTNVERGARMASVDPELQDPNAPASSHVSTRPVDSDVPKSISRMSPDSLEQGPMDSFATAGLVEEVGIEKGDESGVITIPTCKGEVTTAEGEEPMAPSMILSAMKGFQSTLEAGGEGMVEQANEGERDIQVGIADPTPCFSGDNTPVVAEAVSDDNPSSDTGTPVEIATETSMAEEKAQAMKEGSVSEVKEVGSLRDAETIAIELGKEAASATVVGKGEEGMGITTEIDVVTAAEAIAPVVLEAAVDQIDLAIEGLAPRDASAGNDTNPADIAQDWAPSGDVNVQLPALADSGKEVAAPSPQEVDEEDQEEDQEVDQEVSESTKRVTDPHDSETRAEIPGMGGIAHVSRPERTVQVINQGDSGEMSTGVASSKQEMVYTASGTAGGAALSNIQVTGGMGQAWCGDGDGDDKEPMKEAELEVEEVAVVELVDDEEGPAVLEKQRAKRFSAPVPELMGDYSASMSGVLSAPVSVGSATSAEDLRSHSMRTFFYSKSDSETSPRALKTRKGGSFFLRRRKHSHDEPLSSHRSETKSSTGPKKVAKILRGLNKAFRHMKGEPSSKEGGAKSEK